MTLTTYTTEVAGATREVSAAATQIAATRAPAMTAQVAPRARPSAISPPAVAAPSFMLSAIRTGANQRS